jgi:hypothetical protein
MNMTAKKTSVKKTTAKTKPIKRKARGIKPERYSVRVILAAIENSGGIKQTVAKKLGVSRHTVTNYQRKHPSVAAAFERERGIIKDKAESNIFTKIQNGDVPISQWFLRYKGGYVEKTEMKADVAVKGKMEVKHKLPPKIAKMIGDELAKEEEGQ